MEDINKTESGLKNIAGAKNTLDRINRLAGTGISDQEDRVMTNSQAAL